MLAREDGERLLNCWKSKASSALVGIIISSAWFAGPSLPAMGDVGGSSAPPPTTAGSSSSGIDYLCLAGNCAQQLAEAAKDVEGRKALKCLSTCKGDDMQCQVACTNKYGDGLPLQNFSKCAISQHHCIPQRESDAQFRVDLASLPSSFDPRAVSGEWYIVRGLSPLFDCWPSQHHVVTVDNSGIVDIDVDYFVPSESHPAGGFKRLIKQAFLQDVSRPPILHQVPGNLGQRDDWYVLEADPNSHMLVYYRGSNDAYRNYVGGVLYSRQPELDDAVLAHLTEIAAKHGISLSDMCLTDNSRSAGRIGRIGNFKDIDE
jgi:violaxanthin de-epoxidase